MVIRQSAIQTIRKLTCQHSVNRYRESLKELIIKEPLNQQRETRKVIQTLALIHKVQQQYPRDNHYIVGANVDM